MMTETSGSRNVGSGAMAGGGTYGYYWLASPWSVTDGLPLSFTSGLVWPQGVTGARGNGFPLRCIQEFALPQTKRALWKRRDRTC